MQRQRLSPDPLVILGEVFDVRVDPLRGPDFAVVLGFPRASTTGLCVHVEILAADAAVLNTPNRITKADFDHWVEQRGSKFWSSWDSRYTPIIATWDRGQAPQKGGWLHARYGKGNYTYFAYALHRQLPYGVPGAYRIVANLLAQK